MLKQFAVKLYLGAEETAMSFIRGAAFGLGACVAVAFCAILLLAV